MKLKYSGTGEMSFKDWKNMLFLWISFFGSFYLANTDIVNEIIGKYVSPESVGIVTTFIAYFFKQLLSDNDKPSEESDLIE